MTKKHIFLPLLGAAALLLSLTALLLWQNRGALAIWWASLGEQTVSLTESDLPIRYAALTELEADPSVTLDQSLMLVNTAHPLPGGFLPAVAEYKTSDVMMNTAILDAYAALSAAVGEKCGDKLYVSSSLRTAQEQEALYAEDPTTATLPGASEHQTGLALDVYVAYFAGDGFLDSPAGQFVNARCQDYGFIIRYPAWGTEQTGIRFEPWHIRYVGQPHARVMASSRLTLEEYIDRLAIGVCYEADGAYILRSAPDESGRIAIPNAAGALTVSPDNTGCYIATVIPE